MVKASALQSIWKPTLPTTQSHFSPAFYPFSAVKAPPELPGVTDAVPWVVNGSKQSRPKEPARQIPWGLSDYKEVSAAGSTPQPSSSFHIHPDLPKGCFKVEFRLIYLARTQVRDEVSLQEDPMSSHSSPGWHNPALLPTHSVNGSGNRPSRLPGLPGTWFLISHCYL